MKRFRSVLLSASTVSNQFGRSNLIRTFSTSPFPGFDGGKNFNSSKPVDDFEQRIFGNVSGNGPNNDSFFRKLDKAEKAHDQSFMGSMFNTGNGSSFFNSKKDQYDTLSDGMGLKLKKAAIYFEYDPEEVAREDYAFRPDVNLMGGMTYDTKDLDLKKPGVRKPPRRSEFETTTEEVLRKADFRNVNFLANFITEAGIIIKRSQTGISAKAQRKVAREIKTARAFGLMPFTTMGTKRFTFGRTMEHEEGDFGYEIFERSFVDEERGADL